MKDVIYANSLTRTYYNFLKYSQAENDQTDTATFLDRVAESESAAEAANTGAALAKGGSKNQVKGESVVDQFKSKHPKEAYHVEKQVQAGKAVKVRNGVEHVSTDDMTMQEYKKFITELLNSIPFDYTRVQDEEIIYISDEGWEQMKNDSEYEAWVLGYVAENRAVRNPFFGWPGVSGSFGVERFGASIEEHIGQGFSKAGPGSSSGNVKKEKSWWDKRHERIKKNIAEQAERARRKAQARSALAQADYWDSQFASKERLRSFLMEGERESDNMPSSHSAGTAALVAATYDNSILAFSKNIMAKSK